MFVAVTEDGWAAEVGRVIRSLSGGPVGVGVSASGEETILHPGETASLSIRSGSPRASSFAIGRQAARKALAELGVGGAVIPVGDGGQPIWPPGVVGSISHAGGLALALVADADSFRAVGVDLETERDVAGIEELVLVPEERELLSGLEREERDFRLLEVFSIKETVYKAFYPELGRYFGFESARTTPLSSGDGYRVDLAPELGVAEVRDLVARSVWVGEHLVSWLLIPGDPSTSSAGNE